MAITSQEPRAGFPLFVELTSVRMPKRSWVKVSQVRTLSVDRIERRIGRVSSRQLNAILEGLNEIVGG